EDGYGHRPDDEEDGHAISAAREVAEGLRRGTLPPFVGIRIKPLNPELRARALRTLDLFVTEASRRGDGALPPRFVVTLPKITFAEQVSVLVDALQGIESRLGLPRSLPLALMIETPQSILDPDGGGGPPHPGRAADAH